MDKKKTVGSLHAGCRNKSSVYSVFHFGPLPKVPWAFGKYCPWVNALELNVHNNPCGEKSQSSSKGAQLEPLLIVQTFCALHLSFLFNSLWSCIVQHNLLAFVHTCSYYLNHWVQFLSLHWHHLHWLHLHAPPQTKQKWTAAPAPRTRSSTTCWSSCSPGTARWRRGSPAPSASTTTSSWSFSADTPPALSAALLSRPAPYVGRQFGSGSSYLCDSVCRCVTSTPCYVCCFSCHGQEHLMGSSIGK